MALDGFGLVPGSFTAFELRRFAPELGERLDVVVERSIRRFRPALVVIATTGRQSPLARRALAHARSLGVPTVMLDVTICRRALLSPPPSGFDKLAQVVTAFVPELAWRVRPAGIGRVRDFRRWLAPAWNATAAAVVALIDHAPESAAALIRGDLPKRSQLPSLIAAAFRRAHPEDAL